MCRTEVCLMTLPSTQFTSRWQSGQFPSPLYPIRPLPPWDVLKLGATGLILRVPSFLNASPSSLESTLLIISQKTDFFLVGGVLWPKFKRLKTTLASLSCFPSTGSLFHCSTLWMSVVSPGLLSVLWERTLFLLHIIPKDWCVLLTQGMYSVTEYATLRHLCSDFSISVWFCLWESSVKSGYTYWECMPLLEIALEGRCCWAEWALLVYILWLQLPMFV